MSSLGGKLRKLDIYQKVNSEVSTGTNIGGIISIITTLVMAFFIIYEISEYVSPDLKADIQDDEYFTRN